MGQETDLSLTGPRADGRQGRPGGKIAEETDDFRGDRMKKAFAFLFGE